MLVVVVGRASVFFFFFFLYFVILLLLLLAKERFQFLEKMSDYVQASNKLNLHLSSRRFHNSKIQHIIHTNHKYNTRIIFPLSLPPLAKTSFGSLLLSPNLIDSLKILFMRVYQIQSLESIPKHVLNINLLTKSFKEEIYR